MTIHQNIIDLNTWVKEHFDDNSTMYFYKDEDNIIIQVNKYRYKAPIQTFENYFGKLTKSVGTIRRAV